MRVCVAARAARHAAAAEHREALVHVQNRHGRLPRRTGAQRAALGLRGAMSCMSCLMATLVSLRRQIAVLCRFKVCDECSVVGGAGVKRAGGSRWWGWGWRRRRRTRSERARRSQPRAAAPRACRELCAVPRDWRRRTEEEDSDREQGGVGRASA